jgi:hypothetical protein
MARHPITPFAVGYIVGNENNKGHRVANEFLKKVIPGFDHPAQVLPPTIRL